MGIGLPSVNFVVVLSGIGFIRILRISVVECMYGSWLYD